MVHGAPIDHSRKYHNIPKCSLFVTPTFAYALFLVSLGAILTPKRNWRECFCIILEWQTNWTLWYVMVFREWSIRSIWPRVIDALTKLSTFIAGDDSLLVHLTSFPLFFLCKADITLLMFCFLKLQDTRGHVTAQVVQAPKFRVVGTAAIYKTRSTLTFWTLRFCGHPDSTESRYINHF